VQLVQLSCLSVGDVISPLSSSPIAKHSPSPRRAEWRREELQILRLLAVEEQKRTTKWFHPHPKLSGSSVSALRALTLPLCRRCVPLQACRGSGICAGTEPRVLTGQRGFETAQKCRACPQEPTEGKSLVRSEGNTTSRRS